MDNKDSKYLVAEWLLQHCKTNEDIIITDVSFTITVKTKAISPEDSLRLLQECFW